MDAGRLAERMDPPAHLCIHPSDSLSNAARKIVGQQTLKVRENVEGALADLDPEYLHDLRVAVRRLRTALRLFAEVLGRGRCRTLRSELGWIGQILGAMRDLDVFTDNLQAQAPRLAEAGTIAETLAAELHRQRDPARATLVAALTSRRFSALRRRLEALASSPLPHRLRATQAISVVQAGPDFIRREERRVLKLGRTFDHDSPPSDLHRLRILFKRLRYTCEFFRDVFVDVTSDGDPLKDYIARMVRFQDCLGEHQDAVVAMARIQRLAKDMVHRGLLASERLVDVGGLVQVQREIARKRRERLAKLWRRFDKSSVRQQVAALGAAAHALAAGSAPESPSP